MFDERTLPNGLKVVGERIPFFRSVSVGVWIGAGSQYETKPLGGVSHFIEHMLFKGTEKRTALQIAEEMDAVGGQLNAFTAKECTCFYAKVVDEHLPLALDMLSDLVLHAKLDEKDIEKEKGVVLEEISMAEDSPEDVASELIMLARYGDQPLARPILGEEETVSSLTRADVTGYMDAMYRPENAVLALAGNYDWDRLNDWIDRFFGGWARGDVRVPIYSTASCAPGEIRRDKDIEQVHLCVGYPGVPQEDPLLYPLSLLNSVLGGAMSSRLFQKIREERGMAYSVYSYPASYKDTGLLVVYAGMSAENAREVRALIRAEAADILKNGITEAEFTQTREQLKGGYILGLESTSSRMNALGRRKLLIGNTQTESDVINRVNAITYEQVMDAARATLSGEPALSLVGRGAGDIAL